MGLNGLRHGRMKLARSNCRCHESFHVFLLFARVGASANPFFLKKTDTPTKKVCVSERLRGLWKVFTFEGGVGVLFIFSLPAFSRTPANNLLKFLWFIFWR